MSDPTILTLPALLQRAAELRGRATALSEGAASIDYPTLAERAAEAAGIFAAQGVGPGGRVALWLPNGIDYMVAIFALAQLGATAIHLSSRFKAREIGDLLFRSRATGLVTTWGFEPVDFAAILEEIPEDDLAALAFVVAPRPPVATLRGRPVVALAGGAPAPDASGADAPCLTFTTSGTTSRPKLVLHPQRTIASHAQEIVPALGLDCPEPCLLAAMPLSGTFGNAFVMAGVAAGAHLVLMDRFDAAAGAALIRRHRVTHLVAGDDVLGRLAEQAGGQPFDSMRFSGFATFTPAAADNLAAAKRVGLSPRSVYGSSEVQALFAVMPESDPLPMGGAPVSPAAVFDIRDIETGAPLPEGQDGELHLKASSTFGEYLENPDATAKASSVDGFFRTGDVARRVGDRFVFQHRLGDALRLGGYLVDPSEIEAVLQEQPGVAGAQVVGADAGTKRVPVAFLLARPGSSLDPEALRKACRSQLAAHKVPAAYLVLDAYPMTDGPNGAKIQKAVLRQMAAEAVAPGAAGVAPRKCA